MYCWTGNCRRPNVRVRSLLPTLFLDSQRGLLEGKRRERHGLLSPPETPGTWMSFQSDVSFMTSHVHVSKYHKPPEFLKLLSTFTHILNIIIT